MKPWVLSAVLCCPSLPALAEPFVTVIDIEYAGGPIKANIRVDPALRWDEQGRPHFDLRPASEPEHALLISHLTRGIGFDNEVVQDFIAGLLSSFPSTCIGRGLLAPRQGIGLHFQVRPILKMFRLVPGIVDQRRITSVHIDHCLAQQLPECRSDPKDRGWVDIDLWTLRGFLSDCRNATLSAIERGEHHADWVYSVNPSLHPLSPTSRRET